MQTGPDTVIAMSTVGLALVAIIAVLHIGFLILEMFLWTKPFGLKVFRQTREQAETSAVVAANQGLYNGFLAAGLIWSLVQNDANCAFQNQMFFLSCVAIAGAYGAYTVSRRILFMQALPALIAILILNLA